MQKLISKFDKNSIEEILVELSDYKGQTYLNIRAWIKDNDGEFLPTKKGLTCHCELIPDLIEALQKAKEIISGSKGNLGTESSTVP